jgi:predicted DNA-binding transcriptional regulator YafY
MSQFERIYKIDRLLKGKRPPNKQTIRKALEISEATFKRDLEYMRSRLGAPIKYDRASGGYRYASDESEFSLPGLWFSSDEIHALLLITHILDQIQPGLLRDQIRPFEAHLRKITSETNAAAGDSIENRVQLLPNPFRAAKPQHLELVLRATLARRRLQIRYESRVRDVQTDRTVSPLRLLYYRNNWYIDAWCHTVGARC